MPPLLGVVMTLVQDTVLFCGVIPSAKSKNTEQTQKKSKPEGKGKILVSKPAKREVGCNADTVHNQCIDAQFGCTICRGYLLVLQSAWSGENRLNTIRREKILITTGIACPDTASTPQADIAIRKQDLQNGKSLSA